MKTSHTSLILILVLSLLLSGCDMFAAAPTPTPVPLPPPQYLESALQWLQAHAVMGKNVDWAALRKDTANLVPDPKTTSDTYPAICLALRSLRDGNAWFLDPNLEIPNYNDGYDTLYPQFKVVIRINPGGPAEKAGLQVGDVIETSNGQPPKPSNPDNIYPPCNTEKLDSSAQENLVLTRNGQPIQITIEKTAVKISLNDDYILPVGQRLGAGSDGVGYLELTLESGAHVSYPGDVQQLIKKIDSSPVCGWIIDLRRNFGGDIWSYLAAVGPILGEGDLGGFAYLDGTRETWAYRNQRVFWNGVLRDESAIDGPVYTPKKAVAVALLIGVETTGAPELLVVSFQGRPNVHSFGEPTRGLPTLVTHTDLSDGARIFASGAFSFDRNGVNYNGPISPDVSVSSNWTQFGTERDPVIQAAKDWLQSQTTCKP